MTDQHELECVTIRDIAREQCEFEAKQLSSVTHTPIETLSPDKLSAEQCVLMYAIHLDRLRQSASAEQVDPHGIPRYSVNPCEHVYRAEDAETVEKLQAERLILTRDLEVRRREGRATKRVQNRINAIMDQLDQLNTAALISVPAMSVWAFLTLLDITSDEAIHRLAREYLIGCVQVPNCERPIPDEARFRKIIADIGPENWQGAHPNVRKTMAKVKKGEQYGWLFGTGTDRVGFASRQGPPLITKIRDDGRWMTLSATSLNVALKQYFDEHPPGKFRMSPSLPQDSDA